jgi:hypothetical protein
MEQKQKKTPDFLYIISYFFILIVGLVSLPVFSAGRLRSSITSLRIYVVSGVNFPDR